MIVLHLFLPLLFLTYPKSSSCNLRPYTQAFLRDLRARENASSECQEQLDAYVNGFLNGEEWAWNMFDSSSKLPSGLITGNTRDLGNFDQCLDVIHHNIRGKYCLSGLITFIPKTLNLTKIFDSLDTTDMLSISSDPNLLITEIMESYIVRNGSTNEVTDFLEGNDVFSLMLNPSFWNFQESNVSILSLALCLPSTCVPSDLQLPEIFYAFDDLCVTKESFHRLDNSDYAAMAFLIAVGVVMVFSSIYDVYLHKEQKKPLHKIFVAFSVYTNGKQLLDTTKNKDHLLCFGGLKTISILWVMLGHRFTSSQLIFSTNFFYISEFVKKPYTEYIQCAQYAVDTFLVLSGCLMAYLTIKPMSVLKSKLVKMNLQNRIKTVSGFTLLSYVHRYLRLTPAVAVLYMFYITLLRRTGSGPIYTFMTDFQRKPCVDNWWSFFLYIENYVHTKDMCIVHTWYINVDMQIFLLSPLILWPIVLYPKKMLRVGLPLLTVVATIVTFCVAYINEIEWYSPDYYNLYYYVTHTRLAPWFIGLALGVFLYHNKEREFKINKSINICMWMLILAAMVILSITQHDPAHNYRRVKTAFWTALHKPAWAVCICWIVFACVKGYGGVINDFLSCSVFQVIGRLTYCMYLVQFFPIILDLFRIRVPIYFEDITILRSFLADCLVTTLIATLWTLAFEAPMRTLEKVIFGAGVRRKADKNQNTETTEIIVEASPGKLK